jgi:hypothetical protein
MLKILFQAAVSESIVSLLDRSPYFQAASINHRSPFAIRSELYHD